MAKSKTVTVVTMQNRRMATTSGHVIQFKRNTPKDIPRSILADAMAIGATPVEQSDLPEQPEPEKKPETSDERREAMLEAIGLLHERQERGDFTANGLPQIDKIEELSGVTNVHGQERDAVWIEFKDSLNEESEEGDS